ncbi:RNA binding protein, putative [Theobroma cacao]|uniref:RNA binding protein, putative n=1 Tax=Theobroma cacao TaxID=3641 RepID=A0A061GB34_THECC|nr:RNA binding protein, putative [Theobroma cacao]
MAILTWTPPPTAVPAAVTASWDTQQRPSYNPNAPRKLKPNPNLKPSPTVTLTTRTDPSVFDILKRPTQEVTPVKVDTDESYMGYERWLPTPPKVAKPRSVFNAATLAYIGDCIYEVVLYAQYLYARRHFLFPPLSIEEYNDRVTSVVRCEAQDALLQELLDDSFLSNDERNVLRWGKNISSSKTRTKKRAGAAVYNRASSLETLIGYLYLTNVNRLEKLMVKLGFSTGASTEMILKEVNGKLKLIHSAKKHCLLCLKLIWIMSEKPL